MDVRTVKILWRWDLNIPASDWLVVGWADVWLAELLWQSLFYPVIWKCCNNNLKTIGMREYGIKSIHLMLNLWSIQVQMWMSWTFHSWSMLSVCVTMCPHGNFIQHLAEECLLLMQLRPAQGPESQQFHDHLHDDIERGFFNLNGFHDRVKGLYLIRMMRPDQQSHTFIMFSIHDFFYFQNDYSRFNTAIWVA